MHANVQEELQAQELGDLGLYLASIQLEQKNYDWEKDGWLGAVAGFVAREALLESEFQSEVREIRNWGRNDKQELLAHFDRARTLSSVPYAARKTFFELTNGWLGFFMPKIYQLISLLENASKLCVDSRHYTDTVFPCLPPLIKQESHRW